MHLHRFYSHNSSFVHGGVEKPGEEQPPAMGQAEIHKKICSLNFKDCHAKIRQVDSQATVAEAVVVQVTGELSNSGQPMRRFMQTFVLVPQAPKQYYVHNDIFRYQDEVFHDNDEDTDPQEESVDSDMEDAVETAPTQDTVQSPAVSTTTYFNEAPQVPPMSNGTAHVDERVESPPPKPVEEPVKVEEPQPAESFEPEAEKTPEPEPAPAPSDNVLQFSGPPASLSWAAMLTKNAPAGTVNQPTATPTVIKPSPPVIKTETKADPTPASGPQPQRAPRPTEEALPQRPPRDRASRESRDGSRNPGDADDPRRPRHPDSHQVFVGNLPHHMSETELKAFFEQFGKVVELRINKKTGSTSVPNYGFVVFDDDKTVQNVLNHKGGFLLPGGLRLNVEEKKQRGDSGRPGSGTRGGGRGGSSGPGRGGPRGGRGGPGGARPDNRERSGDRPARGSGGDRGGFGPRR